MLITDFLLSRKSVRTYKNKALSNKEIESIEDILEIINKETDNVEFTLHSDGDRIYKALDGHGGYGGVMIDAPAYISMNIIEESPKAYIDGAYEFEEIVTKMRELSLGSCWITLSNCSEELLQETFNNEKGVVKYLLGLGHPTRDLNFGNPSYTPKIGVEDYVFKNLDKEAYTIDELESLGLADLFYYLRLAPSSKDKQAWRFVIDEGEIKLYIENLTNIDDYVDTGIVLYYFDGLASASGLRMTWDIDVKDEGDFVYIGKTHI